jgi:hypothetical protein
MIDASPFKNISFNINGLIGDVPVRTPDLPDAILSLYINILRTGTSGTPFRGIHRWRSDAPRAAGKGIFFCAIFLSVRKTPSRHFCGGGASSLLSL